MKRFNNGKRRVARKRQWQRRLAFEALEPKRVLDASFGFLPVAGGFAFQITGTDFAPTEDTPLARPDNIVIWTDVGSGGNANAATNFFLEWVDDGGAWHSLSGSVSAGDIADEAQDRGLLPGDFDGFHIKALGGGDLFHANGAPGSATPASTDPAVSMIGIYDGAAIEKQVIYNAMVGQRITVDGNGGHDLFYGSPEDDIIRGGADKDEIWALAGNDVVFGGTSDDVIWGGTGKDSLEGDEGRDEIHGEEGDDFISGGPGDDGERRSDGSGSEFMPGVGLFGGPGNDTVDGGDGADDLTGDEGSDKLIGGNGHDSLLGDHLDKNPVGGGGTDAWQAGPTTWSEQDSNPSKHVGVQIEDGTLEKVDTTGKDANEPTLRVTATVGGISMVVIRTDIVGPFGNSADQPYSFSDHVDLSAWTNDSTSGVQIATGGGNDFLGGSDPGRDWLDAGDGNDTAIGLGNADAIYGQGGDDLISGGGGGDFISGGSGLNDTATYNEVKVGSKTFPGSPAAVRVQLSGFGSGGDAQGDRLTGTENLIGSEFDDILSGNSQDNKIEGRGGNDTVFGGNGSDELLGGENDDDIRGGAADDTLRGGKGEDSLFGESGSDTLFGEIGNDFLDGGRNDPDGLSGGKGEDTLVTEFLSGRLPDLGEFPEAPIFGVFGDEGDDNFQILDAQTATDEFFVRSLLTAAETEGRSDFEVNEDFISFVETTVNRPPTIISAPQTTTKKEELYTYNVLAVDPDIGDVLTYSLDQAPSGMSIGPATGLVQWLPGESQVGNHPVKVRVTDSGGLSDTQAYTLTVTN